MIPNTISDTFPPIIDFSYGLDVEIRPKSGGAHPRTPPVLVCYENWHAGQLKEAWPTAQAQVLIGSGRGPGRGPEPGPGPGPGFGPGPGPDLAQDRLGPRTMYFLSENYRI